MTAGAALGFGEFCEQVAHLLPPRPVQPDEELVADLGFDSLARYELVVHMELLGDLELPDDLVDAITTIGDAHAWFCARISEQAA